MGNVLPIKHSNPNPTNIIIHCNIPIKIQGQRQNIPCLVAKSFHGAAWHCLLGHELWNHTECFDVGLSCRRGLLSSADELILSESFCLSIIFTIPPYVLFLTRRWGDVHQWGVDLYHSRHVWRGLPPKDLSEINAFRHVWPNADYQLCYWHVLRALKKRLATRKRAPAPYSLIEAQRQFEFIDNWFLPIGQRHELSGVDVSVIFYSFKTKK